MGKGKGDCFRSMLNLEKGGKRDRLKKEGKKKGFVVEGNQG